MKSGVAMWVPVECREQYESEGWKITSRWSNRPYWDSYLMIREREEAHDGLSRISAKEIADGIDGRIQSIVDP